MSNSGLASSFRKTQHKPTLFILAVFSLFYLGGCGLKSPQLVALENLVAGLQLTTGREVSRALQDKGVALGKPVHAEIVTEYEPINHHTPKEVFDEIITILEKNNWKGDEWNIVPDYFSLSLKEGDTTILAKVRIDSNKKLVSLRITNLDR